jgi:hypothetical protein
MDSRLSKSDLVARCLVGRWDWRCRRLCWTGLQAFRNTCPCSMHFLALWLTRAYQLNGAHTDFLWEILGIFFFFHNFYLGEKTFTMKWLIVRHASWHFTVVSVVSLSFALEICVFPLNLLQNFDKFTSENLWRTFTTWICGSCGGRRLAVGRWAMWRRLTSGFDGNLSNFSEFQEELTDLRVF